MKIDFCTYLREKWINLVKPRQKNDPRPILHIIECISQAEVCNFCAICLSVTSLMYPSFTTYCNVIKSLYLGKLSIMLVNVIGVILRSKGQKFKVTVNEVVKIVCCHISL